VFAKMDLKAQIALLKIVIKIAIIMEFAEVEYVTAK
jgi:hypothetical protein